MSEAETEPPLEGELIPLDAAYEGEDRETGRPRLYATPDEFDARVNEYYQYCLTNPNEPLTMSGLALFMGFSSRQTLFNYATYDGFLDAVTRARTMVQYGYEKNVMLTKNAAAARLLGAIDDYWNPTTKVEGTGDGMKHEDRLAHLR